MEQQIIKDLVQSVAPELWWLFLQMMVTATIGLGLYKAMNQLVNYFFVRFDRELSKNVGVVIDGRKGYIAHISIRNLIIRYDDNHNELIVPLSNVLNSHWEIIKERRHE